MRSTKIFNIENSESRLREFDFHMCNELCKVEKDIFPSAHLRLIYSHKGSIRRSYHKTKYCTIGQRRLFKEIGRIISTEADVDSTGQCLPFSYYEFNMMEKFARRYDPWVDVVIPDNNFLFALKRLQPANRHKFLKIFSMEKYTLVHNKNYLWTVDRESLFNPISDLTNQYSLYDLYNFNRETWRLVLDQCNSTLDEDARISENTNREKSGKGKNWTEPTPYHVRQKIRKKSIAKATKEKYKFIQQGVLPQEEEEEEEEDDEDEHYGYQGTDTEEEEERPILFASEYDEEIEEEEDHICFDFPSDVKTKFFDPSYAPNTTIEELRSIYNKAELSYRKVCKHENNINRWNKQLGCSMSRDKDRDLIPRYDNHIRYYKQYKKHKWGLHYAINLYLHYSEDCGTKETPPLLGPSYLDSALRDKITSMGRILSGSLFNILESVGLFAAQLCISQSTASILLSITQLVKNLFRGNLGEILPFLIEGFGDAMSDSKFVNEGPLMDGNPSQSVLKQLKQFFGDIKNSKTVAQGLSSLSVVLSKCIRFARNVDEEVPLIGQLVVIVRRAVTLSIFPDSNLIKSVLNIPKFKKYKMPNDEWCTTTLVLDSLAFMSDVTGAAADSITKSSVSVFLKDSDSFIKWKQGLDEFLMNARLVNQNIDVAYLQTLILSGESLVNTAKTLLPILRSTKDPAINMMLTDYRLLNMKILELRCKTLSMGREEPLSVCIEGPPEIGKTSIINAIHASVAKTRDYSSSPDSIYYFNVNDEYYSGYVNQLTMVIDDLGFGKELVNDLLELIPIKSTVPYRTNQAELEDKAIRYLNVLLLITTTNNGHSRHEINRQYAQKNMDLEFGASKTFNCTAAFSRRLEYRVLPRVRPEFSTKGGALDPEKIESIVKEDPSRFMDYWLFEVRKVYMESNKAVARTVSHDFGDGEEACTDISLVQLMNLMQKLSIKQRDKSLYMRKTYDKLSKWDLCKEHMSFDCDCVCKDCKMLQCECFSQQGNSPSIIESSVDSAVARATSDENMSKIKKKIVESLTSDDEDSENLYKAIGSRVVEEVNQRLSPLTIAGISIGSLLAAVGIIVGGMALYKKLDKSSSFSQQGSLVSGPVKDEWKRSQHKYEEESFLLRHKGKGFSSTDQVETAIKHCAWKVELNYAASKVPPLTSYGTSFTSDIIIMPSHCVDVEYIKEEGNKITLTRLTDKDIKQHFEIDVVVSGPGTNVVVDVEEDLCLIKVPRKLKSLSKHSLPPEIKEFIGKAGFLNSKLEPIYASCYLTSQSYAKATLKFGKTTWKQRETSCIMYHDAPYAKGSCGLPVFVRGADNRWYFYGVHVAGCIKTGAGFARRISLEQVADYFPTDFIKDIDHGIVHIDHIGALSERSSLRNLTADHDAEVLGTMDRNFSNTASKVRRNPLLEHIEPDKVFHGPPKLRKGFYDGKYHDPYKDTIVQMGTPPKARIPQHLLKRAREEYLGKFKNVDLKSQLSKISRIEALQGLHEDIGVHSMNLSTGAGEPFVSMKKNDLITRHKVGATELWVPKDQLNKEIDRILACYEKGQLAHPILIAHLKDEPRKLSKIDKPRIFYINGFAWNIVVSMYLKRLNNVFQRDWRRSEMAIGMNPRSLEWDKLARWLNNFKALIDGDFKNFDLNLHVQLLDEVCSVIQELCRMSTNYSEKDLRVIQCFFEEMKNPYVRFGPDLAFFPRGFNPSGSVLTTIVNCIANLLILRSAYYQLAPSLDSNFSDHVHLSTLGDDNVSGVSKFAQKFYKFSAIRDTLAKWDITYTDANKLSDPPDFKPLNEVSFLSRGFKKIKSLVERGQDVFWCPLEETSIFKTKFYLPSKIITEELSQLEGALAFLDNCWDVGEEFYEEKRKQLASGKLKTVYDVNDLPTYQQKFDYIFNHRRAC